MPKEKKKGFFAKLFGGCGGGCCCCNAHIEEVKDNEPEKTENKPQDEKNSSGKRKPDAETQG